MKTVAKALPLILAVASATVLAQTAPRSFSLGINVARGVVRTGEPIVVKIQLKNTSDHEIGRTALPGGATHGEMAGFPPIVRDAQGKEPQLTKWGRQVFGRQAPDDHLPDVVLNAIQRVPMSPGELMKTEIHLSELYDVSAPGKYTVQVRYYDEENKEEVKSNTVTVTVVR